MPAMPPIEPVPVCNICGHMVMKMGYSYECTEKCRCTMNGCVPRTDKYKPVRRKPKKDIHQ